MPSRIIVVEDEPLIRMLTVDVLVDDGFEVVEVENAMAALACLEESASDIAVLFTDVRMPGSIDGLALVQHASVHWPWVKLLIASGRAQPTSAELPPGSRFMSKPYFMAGMLGNIRELSGYPANPQAPGETISGGLAQLSNPL